MCYKILYWAQPNRYLQGYKKLVTIKIMLVIFDKFESIDLKDFVFHNPL